MIRVPNRIQKAVSLPAVKRLLHEYYVELSGVCSCVMQCSFVPFIM